MIDFLAYTAMVRLLVIGFIAISIFYDSGVAGLVYEGNGRDKLSLHQKYRLQRKNSDAKK